jgi:hypothetical protein
MRLHAARYAKDNTGHGTAQRASATPAQRMVLRAAMRGALIGCSCGAGRPRPPAATDYFLADDARHGRCAVASAEYFQYPRDGACVPACACVGACAHAWARLRVFVCGIGRLLVRLLGRLFALRFVGFVVSSSARLFV